MCDTRPLRRVAHFTLEDHAHQYVIRIVSKFNHSDIGKIIVLCTLLSLIALPLVIPA